MPLQAADIDFPLQEEAHAAYYLPQLKAGVPE